ncbi:hypothetical protein FF124_07675 [Martelella lutilitoris]|uniref:Uncharacterized protein n=1 Tax=Martelella lutilitoris TaxID=2583532 RepID=A0A5C4JSF4_9HYPH|nr:hypothetical protein [Martelella lutilitoris]TNB48207.1 hypothetical protein FF124_07675 [Martelella lutilitoris]
MQEDKATDEFLKTVGTYVIVFQAVESKIEEIIQIWCGLDKFERTKRKLARLTTAEKISKLSMLFLKTPENRRALEREGYPTYFADLVARLEQARLDRNRLVHSHYLFDFMRFGGPIIQADHRKGPVSFSEEEQQRLTTSISQLYIEVGRAHRQAIHDFEHLQQD